MSVYRYLTTDLITGQLRGDWLPITGLNFARSLNNTGAFMGSLNLKGESAVATTQAQMYAMEQGLANVASVTPRQTVLWIFQDNALVWNGVIWDWNHMSILDGTLPLAASTLDSVMAHRVITANLVYTDMDVFDIFRALVEYGVSKTSGGIAGLTLSNAMSGITDTLTFGGTGNQLVSDAISTLVSAYGIEYTWRPYQDQNGGLHTSVDISFELGRNLDASGLAYQFPGNLLDYRFTATGSTSANRVYATATAPTGGAALIGEATDTADIANGYPLLEATVSATGPGFTTDAQCTAFAEGYLPGVTDTQLTPMLTLGGGLPPPVSRIALGDVAQFTATSFLHPAGPNGEPGFQGLGRVTGWTLYPPSPSSSEYAWIQLGGMTLTP